jgi:small-conductance mechanosensitive channel
MFVFSNTSSAFMTALAAFEELLNSPWFYLSLLLIALAAAFAYVAGLLLRRNIDIVEISMGWPTPLRLMFRVMVDNFGIAVFALVTWLMRAVMVDYTWPSRSYALAVAAGLATAWLAICLFTSLIRNPLLVRIVSVTAWVVAALNILGLLHPMIQTLDSFALMVGGIRLSPLIAIKIVLFTALALWVARLASTLLEARITTSQDLTPSMQVLIAKLVRLSFLTIAVVVALGAVGVDLSTFAIFSGAIGVGIGFGLQKIVANFISGVILLADKSVKPGDIVTVGDSFGRVAAMNTRYISVAAVDGREFLIPNEDLVTQKVINWTYSDSNTLLSVKFGVSYLSDPRKVIACAIAAAASAPRVSKARPPSCQLLEFGEWALNFQLSFWIDDPEKGLGNVRSDVMLALYEAFGREGIDMPYLVRDARSRAPAV